MNWTPEALKIVRELNCPGSIEAACEWIAETKKAAEVTSEHVATVLAWVASTNEESP